MQQQASTETASSLRAGFRIATSALLALLVCLLSFGISHSELWRNIEFEGYDFLVALRGAAPPSERVLIVDFDDASVRKLNAFPVPRLLLADVLDIVSAGEPSVIGLDVILDRKRADSDDRHLAQAIARAGNVILVSEYGFGTLSRKEP